MLHIISSICVIFSNRISWKLDSLDQNEPDLFSPPALKQTVAVSSFGSYPSSFGNTINTGNKAQGSMKLCHKSKTVGKFYQTTATVISTCVDWNFCIDLDLLVDDSSSESHVAQHAAEAHNNTSPALIPTQVNKDDRKAELERRREERRQVSFPLYLLHDFYLTPSSFYF